MIGTPISVTRCVVVLTVNCSLPPPFFGTRTSVTPKVPSVRWSKVAFGNARRSRGLARADADAARLRPAADLDARDLARVVARVLDRAVERRLQARRARAGAGELAARAQRADEPASAQVGVEIAEVDAADARRRDLLRGRRGVRDGGGPGRGGEHGEGGEGLGEHRATVPDARRAG